MFDNAERKRERLHSVHGELVSGNVYNLVLGATIWYGLLSNAVMIFFLGGKLDNIDPLVFLIGYFVSCFIGVRITYGSNNPLVSFVGYNFVVVPIGLVLTMCGPNYPLESVLLAASITAAVTFLMMILATAFPDFFASLGRSLFICLSTALVAEIVATLIGYRGDLFDKVFVGIFSLYIGYDWHKAQAYPKTIDNAVDSALDIYLDVINIFIRILSARGRSNSKK